MLAPMNFTELTEDTEETPQDVAERAAATRRSTWVSVVVNLLLTFVQIVVGVLSKSQGLIADGIHSASDLVADEVLATSITEGTPEGDVVTEEAPGLSFAIAKA